MNKKQNEQDKLRKSAEAKLVRGSPSEVSRSADEILHELQVLQIELEMQNEELRMAQLALERSRDHYLDFYDFAPVGYLTLTREGMIAEINLTCANLLGLERNKLLRQRLERFISPEDRDRFHRHLLVVLAQDDKLTFDAAFKRHNGQSFHVQLDCRRMIKEGAAPIVRIVLTDISECAVMVKALREKDYLLSESQRLARIGSWSMAVNTNTIRWSDETYRIYGVTPDTFVPTTGNLISLIYPKDQPAMQEWIRACLAGENPPELEFRTVSSDGNIRTLQGHGDLQYAPDETPLRIIGTVQDITERKRTEEQLRISNQRFEVVLGTVPDLMFEMDLKGRYLNVWGNRGDLLGASENVLLGRTVDEVLPSSAAMEVLDAISEANIKNHSFGRQVKLTSPKGDGWIELSIAKQPSATEHKTRFIVLSRDITERKQAEEEIHNLAFYDVLTKLPNRRLLSERLVQTMAFSKRSGCYGALMFLDLDNFKPLNDEHGHSVGDLLLVEAARRIARCVREVDTVARFGGDEFVVVLSELDEDRAESASQASSIAEKIRAALAEPYVLKIHDEGKKKTTIEHYSAASIGVVLFIDHEASAEDILKWADVAMYQAKERGRNQIRFYESKT